MPAAAIQSIYRLQEDGRRFLLYEGDLDVKTTSGTWSDVRARIELETVPELRLQARINGPAAASAFFNDDDIELGLPGNANLSPPFEGDSSYEGPRFSLGQTQGGTLGAATHFVFHIIGAFEISPKPIEVDGGGHQRQQEFALPGWSLVAAPVVASPGGRDFTAVVRAAPTHSTVSREDIDKLHRWLFILLSFIANREVGIGPICGLDEAGRVVWAEWGTPRARPGKSGIMWCPALLASEALPVLAAGLTAVAEDPDLEVIVDRAIGYALAANGEEVIEVRIPIVCSGLELLAWAILQREDWLVDAAVRRRMKTASVVRLFLKWAEIPTAVPESLSVLSDRLKATGKTGWEGPEILFELRNAMVHPPKHLDDIQWPEGKELVDAWLLGTWYLELGLLRVLGYDGKYWERTRLNRPDADLDSVPWAVDV